MKTAALRFFLATVVVAAIGLAAAFTPPIEVAQLAPTSGSYNSAGNHVYASATVSDGTGVVTTVAAAGTYVTVGTASPLAAEQADGSGCITYALATNKFTVNACGAGVIRLRACMADVIGTNSKTWTGAWHRVRSGATTVVGPITRRTEGASAARADQGCVEALVSAQSADTYDFRYDSQTNADTVTTRQASFVVEKVRNF